MRLLSLGLCVLVTLPVSAQDADRFSFSGQVRHRTEFDARDFNTNDDNSWYHLLRTRIGLNVDVTQDVNAFIQVQDARLFGSENTNQGRGTLDGSAPALDFHQAYFKVNNIFDSPFTIQIGRQELAYGNQRLIGSVGWSNIGRSFDAGRLSYQSESATLDFFAAQLSGSASLSTGQSLYGLYSTFSPADKHTIDGFFIVDNNTSEISGGQDAGESMLERYTFGTYVHGTPSALDYELELIYQGGTIAVNSAQLDISAYLVSGALGYTFSSLDKARVGIQYTLLSGDDSVADNESNTFNTLFATNHKFYGFMDFFPGTLSGQGLHDLTGSFSISPSKKLKFRVDVHQFILAQSISAAGDDVLGQELDLASSFQYNEQFSIQAGLSAFFPGEVTDTARGEDTAYWLYLMTVVNF